MLIVKLQEEAAADKPLRLEDFPILHAAGATLAGDSMFDRSGHSPALGRKHPPTA
jgi:hypothetical protein